MSRRLLPVSLPVSLLALIVASASFLGIVAAVPVRAGDGPADALAAADRHEAEGRALLERGEKVAAAKHMMEAWSLRARSLPCSRSS